MTDRLPSAARRRFLATAAASFAGAGSATASDLVPDWTRTQGAPISGYGTPSPFENDVARRSRIKPPFPSAASSLTPLAKLHGIITPAGLHFERHHGGVPAIDPRSRRRPASPA